MSFVMTKSQRLVSVSPICLCPVTCTQCNVIIMLPLPLVILYNTNTVLIKSYY